MATYTLLTDDGSEEEIEASSDREAIRLASESIRDAWQPEGLATYWVYATLRDEDDILVADWTEAIDPEVPDCDAPSSELEDAPAADLAAAWDVEEVEDEGGHAWARPVRLLGGNEENPGVFAHGGGVWINEVCLRCGTLRVMDSWAQDPATGRQGLDSVEYHPGHYASEVEEAWRSAVESPEY